MAIMQGGHHQCHQIHIKKTNSSKSKLTGDFLFKKKDKKENSETEERPEVVNKEALA